MTDVVSILKELISCQSYVDGVNAEEKVINLILKKLRENKNLVIQEQSVEGSRQNLIVTGGGSPKTVLFGHMDTVLPKKQAVDPFNPLEKDGKLYGLGSCDMKSGLAVMLDIALNHHCPEVGYVFSVDEEYNFKGALKLKEIKNLHPEVIINLEPTDLKILNGCRGITEFEIEVYGKSAHSGRKQLGVNAIEGVVALVSDFEMECQKHDRNDIQTTVNLAYLLGGLKSGEIKEVKKMGNVVPNYARAVVEIRLGNNKVDKIFIAKTLEKLSKEKKLIISKPEYKFFLGPMFTQPEKLKKFESAVRQSKIKPVYADINFTGYYELQMLQSVWGGDCFAFGAGPSKMCHMADEYVEISSVLKLQEIINRYLAL